MRAWAPALVLVLAASACTAGEDPAPLPSTSATPSASPSASPTATPTPEPAPEPPVAGACYRLSYEEAVAPTTTDPAVPCPQAHTSQTYAVGDLEAVVDGHLLAVDSERVRAQVAQKCPKRLAAYVGASDAQLRLTLLRAVWFTPTLEDSDLGGAWYRCDVVAVTGESGVAKVRGSLEGALRTTAGRAAYGMCATAAPGESGFVHVLCREPHTWRAISVVDLGSPGRRYPGEKAVRAAGEDGTCADAGREVAEDALDYEWGYEWPTLEQWRAGQTFGRCWAPEPEPTA